MNKKRILKEIGTFEGREYVINKRYFEDPQDPLTGFLIKKYWSKKKQEWTCRKYKVKRTGIKKRGRKRGNKRQLLDKIKELDDKKIEMLYNLIVTFD